MTISFICYWSKSPNGRSLLWSHLFSSCEAYTSRENVHSGFFVSCFFSCQKSLKKQKEISLRGRFPSVSLNFFRIKALLKKGHLLWSTVYYPKNFWEYNMLSIVLSQRINYIPAQEQKFIGGESPFWPIIHI